MDKIKLIFLAVLFIIVTLWISAARPQMHKQVIITDADVTFVEEQETSTPVKIIPTETPKPQSESVQKTAPTKHSTIQKQTKKISPEVTKKQEKPVQKIQKQQPLPKPEKIIEPAPPNQEIKHRLTEKEEIIAWNKWRSDLQNQVMRDSEIAAPLGTGFKFSFTVDKFGNISNIKVWSTNSVYTDTGIRIIKPILQSYQGKSILQFPEGTKRIITNVNGGFVMATSTDFSKPSDYSDYEKVKTITRQ